MRRILLPAAACLLLVAGAASAQTKAGHYAPYSNSPHDTALVTTPGQPAAPGHAASPDAQSGRIGPYRSATGRPMMHHRMMRHHVSARVCLARANARGLHGRAKTHYIQRCEVGRR